jgi:hypothetical protein
MPTSPRFHYNQQVAAQIQYQLRPDATHSALKNSPLFNLVAVTPTAIVKRRPWFGFDRDTRMDDIRKPILHAPDDLKSVLQRLDTEGLEAFESMMFDEESIRMVIQTSGGKGNLSLKFDTEMSQSEVATHLEDNLHFERLAKLVERISRALKSDDRGALLSLEVSYAPAFG